MSAEIRSIHFHTSDGVRLHILEAAPAAPAGAVAASRPVVALVPGWSMPARIWQPQLEALGARWRVAALDPRGQGDSEVPEHGFEIDRRAADVREFVARYRHVILVGWSLGALEVLQCIHRYGEDWLGALVLVDSSIGEDPPPAPGAAFIEALRSDRRATIEAFVREMFNSPRSADEVRALTDAAMRMPLEASLSLFPRGIPRQHWRDLARGLGKPFLYVVTGQFSEQARALRRNRPETRIALFETAGHALFVDEPDRFNRTLSAFMEETAPEDISRRARR